MLYSIITILYEKDVLIMSEFNRALESFKADFERIKNRPQVSHRVHHTGIGKTFEDIIGVVENNNLLVDYMGQIELKSQRDYTGSMLTLFTQAPTHGRLDNLVELFGSPDNTYPNIKCLHTTIYSTHFNAYKSTYGFKFDIESDKIRLKVKNLDINKIINEDIWWDLDIIKNKVETKCRNIAYISASVTKENENEIFTFKSAKLLSGLTYERFIELFTGGIIAFDIRNGVYKQGRLAGKKHDHGAGFRVPKRNITQVFNIEDI
jgi:hypothetical protein